jgi:hypothetical protein
VAHSVIQGSPAYENWKAWLSAPPEETGVTFEYPFYSDADRVPANRTDFGPYQVLRTIREVPTLLACPSLILRISQVKRHDHPEIAGSIETEIASLLSILSGTRIFSSPSYTRVWGSDDPLGTPIYTYEPIIVPKPPLGSPELPDVLIYRGFPSELLADYPELTPMESRPKLAEMLQDAGGEELLQNVAAEMADYMGATKKFVDFLVEFGAFQSIDGFPDLSKKRKIELLSKVYSYRSRALHGGVAIPAQTVVSLQEFENLVRSASLNWWKQTQSRAAGLRP